MKNEDSIRPGEKIEIELENDQEGIQYYSKVEEIVDDKTLIVTSPLANDHYTYLSVGQVVKVIYCGKGAVYYFDAEVVERLKSEEAVSARLNIISDRYKLQRRNYFRLSIMVPVTITTNRVVNRVTEKFVKRFDTVDISGGGIRIISREHFDLYSMVQLSIEIPGIEHEVIQGKVVRSMLAEKDINLYETAVEFVYIDQKERQAIIKYIFAKQREFIKRGIIIS